MGERKRILHFVHADFRKDSNSNVGGTQKHVHDLAFGQLDEYDVFVVARNGDFLQVTAYRPEQDDLTFRYPLPGHLSKLTLRCPEMHGLMLRLLRMFQIDLVHVHHTIGLSMEVFFAAHDLEIPLVVTLHDYYYVCPTLWMLDAEDRHCVNRTAEGLCNCCLDKRFGVDQGDLFIQEWRDTVKHALTYCSKIFMPTESLRKDFLMYYPDFSDRSMCIEHGAELIEERTFSASEAVLSDKFIGNMESLQHSPMDYITVQGWAFIHNSDSLRDQIYIGIRDSTGYEELCHVKAQPRLDVSRYFEQPQALYSGYEFSTSLHSYAEGEITVFCYIEHDGVLYFSPATSKSFEYHRQCKANVFNVAFIGEMSRVKGSEIICEMLKHSLPDVRWFIFGGIADEKLQEIKSEHLLKTGWYDPQDLPSMFRRNEIDLVGILSIVPESYCYTLTESLLMGVPVLAIDLGAVGQRTREMGCGWVVPYERAAEKATEIVSRIHLKPEEYNNMKKHVQSIKLESMADMIAKYHDQYIACKRPLSHSSLSIDDLAICYQDGCHGAPTPQQTMENDLVRAELHAIKNSIRYRLAMHVRFPFQKQIGYLLRKCLYRNK